MNTNYELMLDNYNMNVAAKALYDLSQASKLVVPEKMSTFMVFSSFGEGVRNVKRVAPQQLNEENFKRRRITTLNEQNMSDAPCTFTFIIRTPNAKGQIRFSNYLSISLPTTLEKVKEAAKDFNSHLNLAKEVYFVAENMTVIKTDEELTQKIHQTAVLTIYCKHS
jgi:hypothetical protein